MELEEERKKKWKDDNHNQMTLKSRSGLLAIYLLENGEPDMQKVGGIIQRKTKEGLFEEDPDVPGSAKDRLYYVRHKTTFTASSSSSSRQLPLRQSTRVSKEAAGKLTGAGGLFGDEQ